MTIKERYGFVVDYFSKHRSQAETELVYANPFELLVAVILSAQCTDKRVNLITPALFRQFPDAESMAFASVEEIFSLIRSVSYPNNKAKHLKGMAEMLMRDFNGEVPERIEELVKLPGVGRKTANVIASVVFNQAAMAVDTHVFRVSARLGLTRNAKTPLEAEKQLMKHLPTEIVPLAHHWLILHGRYVCMARNPACASCDLKEICLHYNGKKGIKTSLSKPAKGKQSKASVVKKKKNNMTHLKAGDKAPHFSGLDQDGNTVSSNDFAGKNLVVYFYPKDDTPGCTAEACNLRDNYAALQKAGFEILGVSTDPVKSHRKFVDKYSLPFRLLADTEKQAAEAFGVWGLKKFMGKEYMGVSRTTFIIDGNGVILKVIDKVETKDHAAQIL